MQNREAIARILKSNGLETAQVTDPKTRREDREDSDIDLLVGGNSHRWSSRLRPPVRTDAPGRKASEAPGDPASLGVASGRREGSRRASQEGPGNFPAGCGPRVSPEGASRESGAPRRQDPEGP